MDSRSIDWESIQDLIQKYKHEQWGLIPLLQEIQDVQGYIPPETIEPIARELKIYPSRVQGVVTFYSGFSLEPKGKYVIKCCKGTACHVKGGRSILRHLKKELELEEGQTSEDFQFSLETVACLGACFLAPTMMVNRSYYGKLSPAKVNSVLDEYSKDRKEA